MTTYIAYYWVSTKGQGQSGLGLEAQKSAVISYVKTQNGIIAEFSDIESGKKDERPEIMKAISMPKAKGAKLIIAKLDRLSRNLTFISSLMEIKYPLFAVICQRRMSSPCIFSQPLHNWNIR